MKILIAGGLGYLGAHLVGALLDSEHQVVVVDNLSNSSADTLEMLRDILAANAHEYSQVDMQFVGLDVRDASELLKLLHEEKPQLVIDALAGYKDVPATTPLPACEQVQAPLALDANQTNPDAHQALLQTVARYNAQVTKAGKAQAAIKLINYRWLKPETTLAQASASLEPQALPAQTVPSAQAAGHGAKVTAVSQAQFGAVELVQLRLGYLVGARRDGLLGQEPYATANLQTALLVYGLGNLTAIDLTGYQGKVAFSDIDQVCKVTLNVCDYLIDRSEGNLHPKTQQALLDYGFVGDGASEGSPEVLASVSAQYFSLVTGFASLEAYAQEWFKQAKQLGALAVGQVQYVAQPRASAYKNTKALVVATALPNLDSSAAAELFGLRPVELAISVKNQLNFVKNYYL